MTTRVALRKESVDRNGFGGVGVCQAVVALRKESVDRNYIIKVTVCRPAASLSARRAWIEINRARAEIAKRSVALRKESVDRNFSRVL